MIVALPTNDTEEIDTRLDRERKAAEEAQRLLLRHWIEYGVLPETSADFTSFNEGLRPTARLIKEAVDAGARGMPAVMINLGEKLTGESRCVIAEVCDECFPPEKGDGKRIMEKAETFHRSIVLRSKAQNVAKVAEAGSAAEIEAVVADLATFVQVKTRSAAVEDLLAHRWIPDAPAPLDDSVMTLAGCPVAARGNITLVKGAEKSGKSAVVAAMIGAAIRGDSAADGDLLGFEWVGGQSNAVPIIIDTEQGAFDWHRANARIGKRAGIPITDEDLVSISMRTIPPRDRLPLFKALLAHVVDIAGLDRIGLVVIDGIADLLPGSVNDDALCAAFVADLMAVAEEYRVAIVGVLHENSGSESSKARGHLGSEMQRKCFAALRVTKTNDSTAVIYGEPVRRGHLPKSAGVAFAWNDQAGMHTTIGTGGEIVAEDKRQKHSDEAHRALAGKGAMRFTDAVASIEEATGLGNRSAKARLKAWEIGGIISKKDGMFFLS